MKTYQSYSGYLGVIVISFLALLLIFLKKSHTIENISHELIFINVGFTFLSMALYEYIVQKKYHHYQKKKYTSLHPSNRYLLKSTFFRFLALLIPFLLFYFLLQNHRYFLNNTLFQPTLQFFDYLLTIFIFLGPPYLFLTLKYRGDKKYEIGDYAILTLVTVKSFYKRLIYHSNHHYFYQNRRAKKVLLLYLVNFFFLTLMARFLIIEFKGFEKEVFILLSDKYQTLTWFAQFKICFLAIFHLLFTIDVTIGMIGYSFASRWLDNRTKSVDSTLSGWMIALICYPPLNSITTELIGYHGLNTYSFITNEYLLMIIMCLILLFFTIYVWSTAALGFKFSNLTNRGIVNIGPYKYIRHPAYISKNFAWWLDNTFVLTNIWASIALLLWNVIYITRALTEERHLKKDKAYRNYIKKVPYRFIPKII